MDIQEFINLTPNKYNTNKKAQYILNKAIKLEQTQEVKNKIREIELFLKYSSLCDFYPTPKNIAKNIVDCANFIYSGFNILEPSAAIGNLADVIKEKYINYADNVTLDCVEIQPELAEHLKNKGHNVFVCDFLNFQPNKKYDLIIMNPPFKDILRHLKKAVELLAEEGQLLCVVPINLNKIKNLIDDRGAIIHEFNFDFSESQTKCKCNLLEINRKNIKDFSLMLFDFFCRNEYECNYIDRYFSLYLEGSYGYESYKRIKNIKNPTIENLSDWLIDFLYIEFNFSKNFIEKYLNQYRIFSNVLLDYYKKHTEEDEEIEQELKEIA